MPQTLRRLGEKGAFYIICGTFLTKLAAFLGSIVLVRLMIKSEYGVLSYMENLYTYAHIFAGYGLNNAVFRYVVLKDSPGEKAGVFDYVVSRGTVFNVVLVAVLSVVAFLYPHQEQFSVANVLLPLMLVAIPLQFVFESGTFTLRALFRNRSYAICALVAVVSVWALKVGGATLGGLVGATASWPAAYLALSAALFFYVRRRALGVDGATPLSPVERKEVNRYSAQYMVTNGLWAMFLQNDILLLGMLTGEPLAVASYKVAYAIPAAMAVFSSAIGIFVAPYFVKNEGDRTWVWKNYLRVLAVSVASIGVVALGLVVASRQVVLFVYGEQYLDAVGVMRVLMVAAFVNAAIRYPAANLLAAMGNIRANMAVSAIGIALQVGLDIALIPRLGMYGAAYVSVGVYAFMAVAITAVFVSLYAPAGGKRR